MRRPSPPSQRFTMLNSPGEEVLDYIKEKGHEIAPPIPIRSPLSTWKNKHLYCRYHREVGHHTDDCYLLRTEIEKLISKGRLQRFVAVDKASQGKEEPKQKDSEGPKSVDNLHPTLRPGSSILLQ